jgi:hypothetical protein
MVAVACLVGAAACGHTSAPTDPTPSGPKLTAPAATAPADGTAVLSLRPTLAVKNGASDTDGVRTYEFQVSDKSDFSTTASTGAFAVLAHQTGVAEDKSGTTSFAPDFDLQPATRLYWRARVVQGTATSDWTPAHSFTTPIVGYNRPGELYDPLIYGTTVGTMVGTMVGSAQFLEGQGLRLNDKNAYVRYQLVQPLSAGEFSLEIGGLAPNGPGAKLKLFSMADTTASNYDSPWLFTAQYRGVGGNPDNCISWKMRLGDTAFQLEPDIGDRTKNIMALDPSHFYFFRAMWDDGFHLVIQNAIGAGTIYDLNYPVSVFFPGSGLRYTPSPHFAYLGSNDNREGPEDGTFPGEIVRNVFIGNKARPASLGSALRPPQ